MSTTTSTKSTDTPLAAELAYAHQLAAALGTPGGCTESAADRAADRLADRRFADGAATMRDTITAALQRQVLALPGSGALEESVERRTLLAAIATVKGTSV